MFLQNVHMFICNVDCIIDNMTCVWCNTILRIFTRCQVKKNRVDTIWLHLFFVETDKNSDDTFKVLESDFIEKKTTEKKQMPLDNIRFIGILNKRVRILDDTHYEIPLPFETPIQWSQTTETLEYVD